VADRSTEQNIRVWPKAATADSSMGRPNVPLHGAEFVPTYMPPPRTDIPQGDSMVSPILASEHELEQDRRGLAEEVQGGNEGGSKHLGWAKNVADVDLTTGYQTVASFSVTTTEKNYAIWGACTFYNTLDGLATGTVRIVEGTTAMGGETGASVAGAFYKFTAAVSGLLTGQTPGEKVFAIQAKAGTSNTRVDATDAWVMGYEFS